MGALFIYNGVIDMNNKTKKILAGVGTAIAILTGIGHMLPDNVPNCGVRKVTEKVSSIITRQPGMIGNTVIIGYDNNKQLSMDDGVRTCRADVNLAYKGEEATNTIEYTIGWVDDKKKAYRVKVTNVY